MLRCKELAYKAFNTHATFFALKEDSAVLLDAGKESAAFFGENIMFDEH